MQIYYGLKEFKAKKALIATIGMFDGVHIAHQTLLHFVHQKCKKGDLESVVITFWPHPRTILPAAPTDLKFLSTQAEKIDLISEAKIDYLVVLEFNLAFSEKTAHDFISEILIEKLAIKELVLGYDHHFGKNREGNIDFLKANQSKYPFEVHEISKQVLNDFAVNSSNIRKLIIDGKMEQVRALLDRNYTFSGLVVAGRKLGRTIGYPTANLQVDSEKIIPKNGVYAAKVLVNKIVYSGMLNIGVRPTVNGSTRTIEVNIFEFNADIYGTTIELAIVSHLRDEIKFESLQMLSLQLEQDKNSALSLLNEYVK